MNCVTNAQTTISNPLGAHTHKGITAAAGSTASNIERRRPCRFDRTPNDPAAYRADYRHDGHDGGAAAL